jgi:hypothetical protein
MTKYLRNKKRNGMRHTLVLLSFPAKRQYTYSNMLKKGTGSIPTKVTRINIVTTYRYKVI